MKETPADNAQEHALDEDTVLSSHRVASLLRVSASAVISWFDQGKLKGFRTPGGHRRVTVGELRRFLESHDMPTPRELQPVDRSYHIYVIDDEQQVIKSLKRGFKTSKHNVSVDGCTDGIEALVAIGANPPDLILLDLYMEGMDGFEVCKRLRQIPQLEEVLIVAMSGFPSDEDKEKILERGAQAYLNKPVRVAHVMEVLSGR